MKKNNDIVLRVMGILLLLALYVGGTVSAANPRQATSQAMTKSDLQPLGVWHLEEWDDEAQGEGERVFKFVTKKGDGRYFIQTNQDVMYTRGTYDEFLILEGTDLADFLNCLNPIISRWDDLAKNHKYQGNLPHGNYYDDHDNDYVLLEDVPPLKYLKGLVGKIEDTLITKSFHVYNQNCKVYYQQHKDGDKWIRFEFAYDTERGDGTPDEDEDILCVKGGNLKKLYTILAKELDSPKESSAQLTAGQKETSTIGQKQHSTVNESSNEVECKYEYRQEVPVTELTNSILGVITVDINPWYLTKDDVVRALLNGLGEGIYSEIDPLTYGPSVVLGKLKPFPEVKNGSIDPTQSYPEAKLKIDGIPIQSISSYFTDGGTLKSVTYRAYLFKDKDGIYENEDTAKIIYPLFEKFLSNPDYTEISLKEAHDKFKQSFSTAEIGKCFLAKKHNTAIVITYNGWSAEIYMCPIDSI